MNYFRVGRVLVGGVLAGLAVWQVSQQLEWSQLQQVWPQIQWWPVAAGCGMALLTVLLKTWRWQLLLRPEAPPFTQTCQALLSALLVNFLLPFGRLGDVSRLVLLGPQYSKSHILTTLLIEKSLDLLFLLLTALFIVPFVALPHTLARPEPILLFLALLFGLLYLVAYNPHHLLNLTQKGVNYLPAGVQPTAQKVLQHSLLPLATLRWGVTAGGIWLLSLLITFTGAMTPFILFATLNLPFSWPQAALLNVVTAVGSLPAAVPGNLGLFEGLVLFTLQPLAEVGEEKLIAYALLYHLAAVAPQLFLGWRGVLSRGSN